MTSDPLNVNARLYKQLSKLLDDLDRDDKKITTSERIRALQALGRVQIMFMALRKEGYDDHAGSAVREIANTFKSNAADKRKGNTKRGTRSVRASAEDRALAAALAEDDDE